MIDNRIKSHGSWTAWFFILKLPIWTNSCSYCLFFVFNKIITMVVTLGQKKNNMNIEHWSLNIEQYEYWLFHCKKPCSSNELREFYNDLRDFYNETTNVWLTIESNHVVHELHDFYIETTNMNQILFILFFVFVFNKFITMVVTLGEGKKQYEH